MRRLTKPQIRALQLVTDGLMSVTDLKINHVHRTTINRLRDAGLIEVRPFGTVYDTDAGRAALKEQEARDG